MLQFGKGKAMGSRFLFLPQPAVDARPYSVPLTRSGGLGAETEVGRSAQIQAAEVEGRVQ